LFYTKQGGAKKLLNKKTHNKTMTNKADRKHKKTTNQEYRPVVFIQINAQGIFSSEAR